MTEPLPDLPDWAWLPPPKEGGVHGTPEQVAKWNQPSQDAMDQMRQQLRESIISAVVQSVRGLFVPGHFGTAQDQLRDWGSKVNNAKEFLLELVGFDDEDLDGDIDIADVWEHIFETYLSDLPGAEILDTLIDHLLNGGQPINALNLFGQLPHRVFGRVPASAITDDNVNLLNNGGFTGSISMDGGGVWTYDATVGATALGSAKTTADGTAKALLSNAVDVSPGDPLALKVKWRSNGYVGTGTPLKLTLRTYLHDEDTGVDTIVGTTTVASTAGPGTTFSQITGTYDVPTSGTVNRVRLRPLVDTGATAGDIWVDDGWISKTGSGPFSGILTMFNLGSFSDLFDPDRDTIWHTIITSILNPLGVLEDSVGRGNFGDAMQSIFGSLTDGDTIADLLPDLEDIFSHIPNRKVLGYGGPADMGESLQEMADKWISGLVGELGTGASFSDFYNVGHIVSSNATLGSFSWDKLGIRNNKGFARGMLPSSTAPLSLEKVGAGSSPYTFNITPTTAATRYENIEESRPLGVVRFMGNYTGTPTAFGLNIYLMDLSNGSRECVYTSGDIKGDISASRTTSKHVLSTPIAQEPGEVYGYELYIVGSGAVFVACGDQSWLHDDPDVYPRRPWSVRSGGAVTVSTVQTTSDYSYTMTNVLYVEPAVSLGDIEIPHGAETYFFNTDDTILIPSWANIVQVICLGAGGGGRKGLVTGQKGEGGEAGEWDDDVWTRGVEFSGTPTITIAPGTGGAGNGGAGTGGTGEDTVASITSHSVTGVGGEGGDAVSVSSAEQYGQSPGTHTVDGIVYAGGGLQTVLQSAGVPQGGGGAGATGAGAFTSGGNGAAGGVWIRFKQ